MNDKNAEGYPDPTAAAALANVTRSEKVRMYRPLVYIASPFAGDTKYNIARARDYFAAHPGINHNGKFELFGDDSSYLADMDSVKTERAYRLARCARFEHGQTPRFRGGSLNA